MGFCLGRRVAFVRLVLLLVVSALALPGCLTPGRGGAYLERDGVRLRYWEEGTGEAVLLLHGLGVHADLNWRRPGVVRSLKDDFRVVGLDQRGHGRSSKPLDPEVYGLRMVEDAVFLLDHLGIRRAHVVGYSMGGFIALKLAAEHPGRCISVSPCAAGWAPLGSAELAELEHVADTIEAEADYKAMLRRLHAADHEPGPLFTWIADAMLKAASDERVVVSVIRAMPALAVDREELAGLDIPALTIIGERDGFLPEARDLNAAMSNHTLCVLEGAGHFTALTRRAFRETLRAFLLSNKMQGGES